MIRFAKVSGIGMYLNVGVWRLDVGPKLFSYVAQVRTLVKMGLI